jgi:hypothetical protein
VWVYVCVMRGVGVCDVFWMHVCAMYLMWGVKCVMCVMCVGVSVCFVCVCWSVMSVCDRESM